MYIIKILTYLAFNAHDLSLLRGNRTFVFLKIIII